jgi:hypothetical protein
VFGLMSVWSILIMQQLPPAQKVKAADDADVYLHDKCLFFVFFSCAARVFYVHVTQIIFFAACKLHKQINFPTKN